MTVDQELARLVATAVAEDRLHVVYQPCVRIADGAPVGVEALLRMRDDEGSLVMPDVFIPVAEQTGAIVDLGLFVLRAACEQVAWWKDRLPPGADFAAGVNLSPRQLQQPGLLRTFEAACGRLDPSAVVLELTESLPPPSSPQERGLLHAMRERGYHLALDDFGTGHASTRSLRELPFDTVKIDRSWTARLNLPGAGGELARSLTGMAVRSGCTVIVEGIEAFDDRDAARTLGCGLGQGYLWSRPVPADELTRWLAVHGGLVTDRTTEAPGQSSDEPFRSGRSAGSAGQVSRVGLSPRGPRTVGSAARRRARS